jgi:hypothetical protein
MFSWQITWTQGDRLDTEDGSGSRWRSGYTVAIDNMIWVGYEPTLIGAWWLARKRYRKYRRELDREHYRQL